MELYLGLEDTASLDISQVHVTSADTTQSTRAMCGGKNIFLYRKILIIQFHTESLIIFPK